ncbi:hypothetical protein F8M41_019553 [Gigaspora margarita]|uniref:Uncharacterized protein n=1 Tax=Gigaspora margarita TaxID=4874 RepID=A0A8H4EKF1_GIGMA|nr:hypothetical protein F8M41_019553 [Gigaspora margarita]
MYAEKTNGCHPAGAGCSKGNTGECGFGSIKIVKWSPGQLEIQVEVKGAAPQAFGHFSFADNQGHHARILQDPKFVSCQHCQHSNLSCQANPFTSTWSFDVSQTPQQGAWFDIWIAVYWFCTVTYSASTRCTSENIHYQDYVH